MPGPLNDYGEAECKTLKKLILDSVQSLELILFDNPYNHIHREKIRSEKHTLYGCNGAAGCRYLFLQK